MQPAPGVACTAVFPQHFLPNLLVFVAGQSAAWYFLRTGRWGVGIAATAALWIIADWVFVAKFVLGAAGADLQLPFASLQITGAATVLLLAWGLWRRRWSAAARHRTELFGKGIACYLSGDHASAQSLFRSLVQANPWDCAAWVALGNVMRRLGQPRRARRCYRRALALDTRRQYSDLVEHQMAQMRPPVAAPVVSPVAATVSAHAPTA